MRWLVILLAATCVAETVVVDFKYIEPTTHLDRTKDWMPDLDCSMFSEHKSYHNDWNCDYWENVEDYEREVGEWNQTL